MTRKQAFAWAAFSVGLAGGVTSFVGVVVALTAIHPIAGLAFGLVFLTVLLASLIKIQRQMTPPNGRQTMRHDDAMNKTDKEEEKLMDNTKLQKRMIRHGELLMIPVESLPENVEQVYDGEEFVVARSETHHHHVAVGDVTVYRPVGGDSADIYLRANKDSVIEHRKSFDRHETLTIYEGLYLCRPKTEYDPFAKLIRQVRD